MQEAKIQEKTIKTPRTTMKVVLVENIMRFSIEIITILALLVVKPNATNATILETYLEIVEAI